jgi:hypothetical protein
MKHLSKAVPVAAHKSGNLPCVQAAIPDTSRYGAPTALIRFVPEQKTVTRAIYLHLISAMIGPSSLIIKLPRQEGVIRKIWGYQLHPRVKDSGVFWTFAESVANGELDYVAATVKITSWIPECQSQSSMDGGAGTFNIHISGLRTCMKTSTQRMV